MKCSANLHIMATDENTTTRPNCVVGEDKMSSTSMSRESMAAEAARSYVLVHALARQGPADVFVTFVQSCADGQATVAQTD
jgi:hypothetical protein